MLASALAIGGPLLAQEPLPPLVAEVALADYGVESVVDVLHGRVAVVHDPQGARLVLHFLRTTPPATGLPPEEPAPEPGTGPGGDGEVLTALWVWRTEELLGDAEERASFLELIEDMGVDRVFLYVPAAEGERPQAGYVPFDGARLGPLLAELRARGALAYALDGDPEYVRPENHAGVLRTVARVAEHNRRVPPEQRFHGVRLDVEPYILPSFQGPAREQILGDYVALMARISAAAREAGLAFGTDIPFWLDGRDEITGEPFLAVHEGERAPVLGHLLGLVDDVAIMAYRTFANGPDGVFAHTRGELSSAQARGVGVFVGVETTPIWDEDLYTLRGRGRRGLPSDGDAPWIVAQETGGGAATIWFVDSPAALVLLAERLGGEATGVTHWFAGQPVPLPGSRLSFHRLGVEAMLGVSAQLLQGLSGHGAFRGLAFHDYRGLSTLLGRR